MPKQYTFPTLYDECKSLEISFLKKHGYLDCGGWRGGTITWSRNGNKTGSIGISTFMNEQRPYLQLDYKCNDKPINYKVPLVAKPSNLGNGMVWFFRCPSTGKLCRKLYLADTYLLHREAFRGCMYEKQTYSKRARYEFKQWDRLFSSEKWYTELRSKYFKSHYKGQPTKKFKKLWQKLRKADAVSAEELLSFIKRK